MEYFLWILLLGFISEFLQDANMVVIIFAYGIVFLNYK